ncbi:unnamed protein product [Prunus armeniaca]
MGSVNTPATPTTRATSTLGLATFSPARTQSYLPLYVGTHPATYGVCQHAGYSYDTCDLNFGPGYILTSPHTIISPLIRQDAPGRVWGLSTRWLLLRHVRPQLWAWLHSHQPAHNHISPHMSGCTRPRMGSVNTPATPTTRPTSNLALATFSPARTVPRKSHGQPRVKLPNLGQTGPRGPRPPNSNPAVSMNATCLGHSSCKFGPDRTVGSLTIARSDGY